MKSLQPFRLKPNPVGKDKNKNGTATQAQLGAEWVDIKNTGYATVSMDGVKIHHVAFANGKPSHWELITSFTGTLAPGKVIRLHSGSGPVNLLHQDDLVGADIHLFTSRNSYVWNNAEGDTSRLTENENGREVETDQAGYAPNPPEGIVLVRSGNRLIPG